MLPFPHRASSLPLLFLCSGLRAGGSYRPGTSFKRSLPQSGTWAAYRAWAYPSASTRIPSLPALPFDEQAVPAEFAGIEPHPAAVLKQKQLVFHKAALFELPELRIAQHNGQFHPGKTSAVPAWDDGRPFP